MQWIGKENEQYNIEQQHITIYFSRNNLYIIRIVFSSKFTTKIWEQNIESHKHV